MTRMTLFRLILRGVGRLKRLPLALGPRSELTPSSDRGRSHGCSSRVEISYVLGFSAEKEKGRSSLQDLVQSLKLKRLCRSSLISDLSPPVTGERSKEKAHLSVQHVHALVQMRGEGLTLGQGATPGHGSELGRELVEDPSPTSLCQRSVLGDSKVKREGK